jgi:hypothetical protein
MGNAPACLAKIDAEVRAMRNVGRQTKIHAWVSWGAIPFHDRDAEQGLWLQTAQEFGRFPRREIHLK